MKNIFKSDANFKQNVTVNKTLTASQIQDNTPIFYNKKQLRIDNITQVADVGGDQSRTSWKIVLDLHIAPIIPLTAEDILNVWIVDQARDEWEAIDSITQFEQINTYSYKFYFNTAPSAPTQEGTYTASILYQYAYEETRSYSDKILLYGKDGILRDIRNRLDNLKSNFESIGFKYKVNDEFSSNIETLTVNSATVDDVILPKEVYDGEKTSLSEILKDIDSRFENVSNATFGELTLTKYGKYITGILPSLTEGEGYESTIESETYKIYSPSQELTFYIYRYKLDHSNNYGNFYNIYRIKYNLTPNTLKITYDTVEQSFATSIDLLPSYVKNYTVNIGYIRNN